jgi:hypothetical protein
VTVRARGRRLEVQLGRVVVGLEGARGDADGELAVLDVAEDRREHAREAVGGLGEQLEVGDQEVA